MGGSAESVLALTLNEKSDKVPLGATIHSLLPRYGPLRRDCLCAKSHCAKFGLLLLAQSLVLCCRPLRRTWFQCYGSKHRIYFLQRAAAQILLSAMGYARNLVMRRGPLWRICSCTLDHSADNRFIIYSSLGCYYWCWFYSCSAYCWFGPVY